LTYATLKVLRLGDVLAGAGDGLRVSTSSADTIRIPVIREAEFYPACAFVRWCAHTASRKETEADTGQASHVCLSAAIALPVGLEKSPLFRRFGTGHVEALTVQDVALILDEVLQRAGQSRGDLDGLRDELLMADIISSLELPAINLSVPGDLAAPTDEVLDPGRRVRVGLEGRVVDAELRLSGSRVGGAARRADTEEAPCLSSDARMASGDAQDDGRRRPR
jgi:hypothetical protein